jgi:hypothetical protein
MEITVKQKLEHNNNNDDNNNILSKTRSINIIKRNGSKCKYVEIFTHRVGSIGAPSRRTVFVRGTSAEQRESPEIAGRNTKANIF